MSRRRCAPTKRRRRAIPGREGRGHPGNCWVLQAGGTLPACGQTHTCRRGRQAGVRLGAQCCQARVGGGASRNARAPCARTLVWCRATTQLLPAACWRRRSAGGAWHTLRSAAPSSGALQVARQPAERTHFACRRRSAISGASTVTTALPGAAPGGPRGGRQSTPITSTTCQCRSRRDPLPGEGSRRRCPPARNITRCNSSTCHWQTCIFAQVLTRPPAPKPACEQDQVASPALRCTAAPWGHCKRL